MDCNCIQVHWRGTPNSTTKTEIKEFAAAMQTVRDAAGFMETLKFSVSLVL